MNIQNNIASSVVIYSENDFLIQKYAQTVYMCLIGKQTARTHKHTYWIDMNLVICVMNVLYSQQPEPCTQTKSHIIFLPVKHTHTYNIPSTPNCKKGRIFSYTWPLRLLRPTLNPWQIHVWH